MSLLSPSPSDSINQIASFSVKINGSSLGTSYKVYSINIYKEINKLSRATVSIIGGDPKENSFDESEESMFSTGKTVEISLGYDQTNVSVFKGIISKHGLRIKKGFQTATSNNLLILDCVDVAVKLTNTYTTEIYEDKSDSDIISSLLSNVSGLSKSVSFTSGMNDFLPKYNCNDWDFILQRAELNGMVVLNSDNQVTVTEPKPLLTIPELTITYGKGMVDFQAEVNAASQYSTFDISSYDPFSEKSVSSASKEPSLIDQGDLDGITISKDVNLNNITFNKTSSLPTYNTNTMVYTNDNLFLHVGQIKWDDIL